MAKDIKTDKSWHLLFGTLHHFHFPVQQFVLSLSTVQSDAGKRREKTTTNQIKKRTENFDNIECLKLKVVPSRMFLDKYFLHTMRSTDL